MVSDAFGTPNSGEREFDRWGRRLLPDPESLKGGRIPWTRATTLASSIQEMWNLQQWQLRMVAHGIGKRADLYALASALDPDTEKSDLQRVCDDAMEAAKAREGANLGTALHGFTGRYDSASLHQRAQVLTSIPADWRDHIATYAAGMKSANLATDRRYVECIVVNTKIKSAGKFDRLVTREDGILAAPINGMPAPVTWTVADLKTEKGEFEFSQGNIAIQLGIYANAEYMWLPDEKRYVLMPNVRKDIAYVLHLPATERNEDGSIKWGIWEVNIAAGWEAVQLCLDVRAWRKRKGLMRPIRQPATPAQVEQTKHDAATAATTALATITTSDVATEPIMCSMCGYVEVEPPNSWCASCSVSATLTGAGLTAVPITVPPLDELNEPGAGLTVVPGPIPGRMTHVQELAVDHSIPGLTDWPARARAVRTREDASALWREASAAGAWTAELEALAKEAIRGAAG